MSNTQCIIYARKSSEAEDRQVLSIEAQVNELKQVAEKLNLEVVDVLTESKSAKEPGRPVFNDLLKQINQKKVNIVLCWKLDRLARNPIDGASIIWAIKKKGIKILTPSQEYSQEDENTILMYIEFGMAQKYIDDLSKNVKRGNLAKLQNGDWPGPAPIGYLNDRLAKRIIPDPERFPLVKKLWKLLLTGKYSIDQLVEIADKKLGLTTKPKKRRGGRPLSRSAFYLLFANPFYYGYMKNMGVIYKGNHKPMISELEFAKVQEILGRPERPKFKRHQFAYSGGLIRCSECGCPITAQNTTNKYGYKYVYYRCTKKSKTICCKQPYIEVKNIEKQILNFLDRITISQKLFGFGMKYIQEYEDRSNNDQQKTRLSALKKKGTIERQLKENMNMRIRGIISDDEFMENKNELILEKEKYLTILGQKYINKDERLEPLKYVLCLAYSAKIWFKKATDSQKRKLLEIVSSNLKLFNGELLILAKKPFLMIEKRHQNPKWWAVLDDIRTFVTSEAIPPSFSVDIKNLVEEFEEKKNKNN